MAKQHVVKQGEGLSSIARQYGFEDWKVLFEHPANAKLKAHRPNPNALMEGDVVVIPELLPRVFKRPVGDWHELKVKREKPKLRLQLFDTRGQRLANQAYTLQIMGEERQGTTDGDGVFEESVPAHVDAALLIVKLNDPDQGEIELKWNLKVGHMDPPNHLSGVQARLQNLGLYAGPLDGKLSAETRRALVDFQQLRGLKVTGVLDDATTQELEKQHDAVT
jgi:N-acetylmuramoyl-L-alanine amidase